MNIGIKESSGDIILFLNSDDYFADNKILNLVSSKFHPDVDIVYGYIAYYNNKKNKLDWRSFKPSNYYKNAYRDGWHAPHPAFFIKRTSIKENFDEALQVSADFDFMFKHQEIFNLNSKPIEIICTIMSNDGVSQSFLNIIQGNFNVFKSIKRFYKNQNFLFFIIKRFLCKLRSTL